ncbi:MAG: hemerythrin domain-containing protein, partial [Acidimicrobiaceae bacterium]|nr:hemerythrin domain-containing protein [Acidimicrobiaceae bacterium]
MSGLFAALSEDHGRILDLCKQLTGGAGSPTNTLQDRKRMADRLIAVAARHEVAEEQVFWPAFRQRVSGADDLIEEALHQEGGAKRLLHELDHTSAGDTDFARMVSHVASALRDHVTLEESQVWPKLQLQIDGDPLSALAAQFA